MNVINFVNILKAIPSEENANKYKELGLDDDFIREYIGRYFFIENKVKQYDGEDPIKQLVSNYDGNSVAIGLITFDIKPYEDDLYYYFGRFEIDLLAINKNTGEINQLEYGSDSHLLNSAAKSGLLFLEALIEAAKFLDECGIDDDLYEDQVAINAIADKCSQLAGGDTYLDFYRVLLGSES